MKTPRQILLERHRSAEPKLDDLRRVVVAKATNGGENPLPHRPEGRCVASAFRETLLSLRWHLAGMTAAWIAVALFNVDHSSNSNERASSASAPKQLMTSLRENRRLLSEAMETPMPEQSPAMRPVGPQRRSDRQSAEATV